MKKLFAVAVIFTSLGLLMGFYIWGGSPTAIAGDGGAGGGAPTCSSKNGDVNASGAVDLSDAVTILNFLFLGNPAQLVPLCETQGSSGMPDTGQTQCYNCSGQPTQCLDCTGRPRPCLGFTDDFLTLQDAFQRTGCPNDANRFTDNGDGTVTDHCTGLMWQKNTADVNVTGSDRVPWCDALSYCVRLEFAGHDDWRLPNVRELQSIVDYGRFDPSIDPIFDALPEGYWSSTSFADNQEFSLAGWAVYFDDGGVDTGFKNSGFSVRAVRNAP